jgi:hypothetical protein
MFACMTAFQVALGLAARGGKPFEHDGLVAAIVPGLPSVPAQSVIIATYEEPGMFGVSRPLFVPAGTTAMTNRHNCSRTSANG